MNFGIVRLAAVVAGLGIAVAACGHHADVTTQSAGANVTTAAISGPVAIAAGTDFYGKLAAPIGTKTSKDGDTFTIAEGGTMFHNNASLKGDVIDGHVTDVHAAGPLHNPGMTLVFDDVQLADGTKVPVNVQLKSMNAFEPKSHHLRTMGMMIGGAVAGHMAAAHAGHAHGGLAGAVGGFALSQALKTDISVPAGTVLEVKFLSPVSEGQAAPAASN